jgi:hypothetical protein
MVVDSIHKILSCGVQLIFIDKYELTAEFERKYTGSRK